MHAAGSSVSAIRTGSSRERAIRSPPVDPRLHRVCRKWTLSPALGGSSAASKCRAIGRGKRASSLNESPRLSLTRQFGRRLRPIRQASRLSACCNCHQPHSGGLVLCRSRRLVSPEKSHQRCSVLSHRHATYASYAAILYELETRGDLSAADQTGQSWMNSASTTLE